MLASKAAVEAGAEEAVFHRGDEVTECAHSNIAIIRADGVVQTAPADNMILAGVARAHFIKACAHFGMPVEERRFTLDEMMAADEIIVLSSGTLCRPAFMINEKPVGGKAPDALRSLQDYLMADYITSTESR